MTKEKSWYGLRDAIIIRACKDYRIGLRIVRKYKPGQKRYEKGKLLVEDCERFFRGRLFGALCTIDPELLMRHLRDGRKAG